MNLLIQAAAEEDILRQIEWYAEQGVADIAQRFATSVKTSIQALLVAPESGAPREVNNSALSGLRTWAVRGFNEFRVYYILRDDLIQVIRILHGKRDVDTILKEQAPDEPPG